jgi:outer membrane protein
VARQEVSRNRAGRFPALDFLARGNRERTGGTLFGGGSDVETANFLVRLSIPVFEGGLMASRIREAEQSYRAVLEEFERQRREVVRTVRSSFYGVTRAISRSQALEQAVASQKLALEARQEGYRSGRYSIVDVLDAERDLFEARSDYARARYDYVLNSLRLRQTVGALGEDDLVTINAWLE